MANIDAQWRGLMPHTITHAAFSAYNNYGEASYGSGTSYTARVQDRVRLFTQPDGRNVVSVATVYIGEDLTVSPKDKITLPDGSIAPIVAVSNAADEDGHHHTTVLVGSSSRSTVERV